MAELVFSETFTPEELVLWLERRLSDIDFQPLKGEGVLNRNLADLHGSERALVPKDC